MATTPNSTKKSPRAAKPRAQGAAAELDVFNAEGKKVGSVALPAGIFAAPWRPDLVHQVTTALAANKRQNRAHTKDRSEVAGGGRKPWRQKGTGRARHGSIRSPLWRHGGITFGPRTKRDYHEKINRKMKVGALYSVLAKKAKDGELVLVEHFSFAAPETAKAKETLAAIAKGANIELKHKNAALVAFASYDKNAIKSFRNLGNVATEEARNLNPLDVLSYRYLLIENPEAAFKAFAKK